MAADKLKIATCQFAVGRSVKRNSREICELLYRAKKGKADIVHFCECALSGYVGTDFPNFEGYGWELLKKETEKIISLAAELGLWVVLGSTHRLTEPNKPYNCLYLIGPDGKIIDRYDKRFCTPGDLRRLSPGNRFVNFTINGVKCSLLICFRNYTGPFTNRASTAFSSPSTTPGRKARASIHISCARQCSAGPRQTISG
jgi:predicted amidohydrolase